MSRRIILFIAASLDGYIAGPNGELDWLFGDQDYGYNDFIAGIDTLVMGRKTYDAILGMDMEWPYEGKEVIVLTRRTGLPDDPRVVFSSRPLAELVEELREKPGKDIWLVGGGELIKDFLEEGLIDEAYFAVHPILLGAGIPLIPPGSRKTHLSLVDVIKYETGLLMLRYDIPR